jgi:hypothetical protein
MQSEKANAAAAGPLAEFVIVLEGDDDPQPAVPTASTVAATTRLVIDCAVVRITTLLLPRR